MPTSKETEEYRRIKQHVFSWLDKHPAGTFGQYKKMFKKFGDQIHTSTWYGYRDKWKTQNKAKNGAKKKSFLKDQPMEQLQVELKKIEAKKEERKKADDLEQELEYYKWKSYGYQTGYIPRLLEEIENQ